MSCTTNIQLMLADLNNKLRIDPYNPELLNQIGCLYYRINQLEEAIHQFKRCISINPNNWQAHLNLGNSYTKKNFIEQAIAHYTNSIKLNNNNGTAIQNLAMLLLDNKNFTAALPYLEKSLVINKEHQTNFEFIEQLSNCYLQTGNIELAIKYLQLACNIDPLKESAHHNIAILYLRNKNYELAEKHFKAALDLNNENYTAKHMLNALQEKQQNNPPEQYIANLFDQYATYYNIHVKDKLKYDLPNKFRKLYAKYKLTASSQNALDFGCGTGLCGIYFRDACINLIGIDISNNMLLEAKKINCYDLLVQYNLQNNSIFQDNCCDLIVAGDLIPYFGELESLFRQVKNLLIRNQLNYLNQNSNLYLGSNTLEHKPPNNLFLFNIESPSSEVDNFFLQKTGRYCHTVEYIEMLANKFDFHIIEKVTDPIRCQDDNPVSGVLFILTSI